MPGYSAHPMLLVLILLVLIPAVCCQSPDTFTLDVVLPPQILDNVIVTEEIPSGLMYLENSIVVSGAATSASEIIDDGYESSTVTWNFDSVDNRDGVNIHIEFQVVVADVYDNADGVELSPCVTHLSFKDSGDVNYRYVESSRPVRIVEPELEIRRNILPSPASIGDEVICSFSICHSPGSTSSAFDVSLEDILPDGLTYVPDSAEVLNGPDNCEMYEASWYFPEIDQSWNSDNRIQLIYRATVTGDVSSANHADLIWYSAPMFTDTDYAREYSTSSEQNIFQESPEFAISIEGIPDPVRPDGTLNYWISYLNRGGPASGTTIRFEYDPASLYNFGYSMTPSESGIDGGIAYYEFDLGEIPSWQSGMILISSQVSGSLQDGDAITSTATIASGRADSQASSTNHVDRSASLSIYKVANSPVISAENNVIRYEISYINNGDTLDNVCVTDVIDKNLELMPPEFGLTNPWPSQITHEPDGIHLVWDAATLGTAHMDHGASGAIQLAARLPDIYNLPDVDSVFNKYKIDADGVAGSYQTLETFVENPQEPQDLAISLEGNPDPVRPDGELKYVINCLNRGGPASEATVRFDYDPDLLYCIDNSCDVRPIWDVSGTDSATGMDFFEWDLGALPRWGSDIFEINLRARPSLEDSTEITTIATIEGGGKSSQASNTVHVESDAPELSIEKLASSPYIGGDNYYIVYTINFANKGDSYLHNVRVTDIIDRNLVLSPYACEQNEGTYVCPSEITEDDDGIHVVWDAETLGTQEIPPGYHRTINLVAQLPDIADPPDVDSVFNRYRIDADEVVGSYKSLETFVIHSLWIKKTADRQAYSRGEVVNYTIAYGNDERKPVDFSHVVIEDLLPDSNYTEFLSASPQPDFNDGNTLLWNIGKLGPGESGKIQLYLKIKENCSEVSYKSSGSVSGVGFANIRQDLNTAQYPDRLTNNVKIYDIMLGELHSASATIMLADAIGTEANIRGHGSGFYKREDQTQFIAKNKSIQVNTNLSERYAPTSFGLPKGRSIGYTSKWSEAQSGKNRVTGASISEAYRYASAIERESTLNLDRNGSTLSSETSFQGAGHIGVLKKSDTTERSKGTPAYESTESYLGNFTVREQVDEYGRNLGANRTVSGTGMVSSDRKISNKQRSYESGTGRYRAEERTDTLSNYMAKDLRAVHEPVSYSYTPNVGVSLSKKWKEGMWSRSGTISPKGRGSNSSEPASFIREEIDQADFLNVSTVAPGLNEMNTVAEFSGRARFEAVKKGSGNDSHEDVEFYDEYIGKYSLSRKTMISGVARFDMPHLSIAKVGKIEPTADATGGNGDHTVSYTITVENDGNRALGPVYITDLFPPETEYVSSSARPTELAGDYARWTLLSLAIGARTQIDLKLKMKEGVEGLVNRVQADGANIDQWVSAKNFSVISAGFLACCPQKMLVTKQGRVDPGDAKLIHYNITIGNRADSVVAATIDDQLPQGLEFIDSSAPPSNVSSSSNTVRWNLIEIRPGENKTIDYRCRALWGGAFENLAHVEAFSLDGADITSTDVISSVFVEGEGYRSSSIWQPPACFGLNCTGQGFGRDWMACATCGAQEVETAPQAGQTCPGCSAASGNDEGYDIP